MIVGETLYDTYPRIVALDDITFFNTALAAATEAMSPDVTKESSPIIFASALSKQTADEQLVIERKLAHSDRVRRKFIMLDVDYNAGEEKLAASLRERAIAFARDMRTPLLLYPTISWPSKPRFRLVFFSKRALNGKQYRQAVTWLADKLEYSITDQSDLSIKMNRNLPSFNDQSQIDAVYSTLDDSTLAPLAHTLWSKIEVTERTERDDAFDPSISIDADVLVWAVDGLAQLPAMKQRGAFWRLCRATAAAMHAEQITRSTAEEVMRRIAAAGDTPAVMAKWRVDNLNMLDDEYARMTDDEYFKTSPSLASWPALNLSINLQYTTSTSEGE